MRPGLICACLLSAAALLLPVGSARAGSDEMKIEAQLIWGTNDTKPDASSKLRPVGAVLSGKLKNSPFKWEHYFEVHREDIKATLNDEKTIIMSRNCVIKVTNVGDDQVKFQLFGKGKLANTVTQELPKGELLITGGDAENSTAWFVVLRQIE
jgi:hypothetical protein